MLISNFVDRQSERPEICPDDFAIVPEMNFEKTNKIAAKRKPRKYCLKNRKDDNNAKEAVEQIPTDNLQNNSLGEQCHDGTLIVEDPVSTTAHASRATVGKRKRRNSTSLEIGNNNHGTLKKRKMVHFERKKDPWWVHAERLEGTPRTHWKCKYCNHVFKGGGVSRLKMHIAGFAGDIVSCPAVPQEIQESTKAELEKQGKKPELRKRKHKGKSKEAVTMDESGPLQICLATGDVPAPGNGLQAVLKKQAKKRTPRRKKQKETSMVKEREEDILEKDVEKRGKKPKPVMEKQKEMNKVKEREEGTMFGKEIGEAPAATGDC